MALSLSVGIRIDIILYLGLFGIAAFHKFVRRRATEISVIVENLLYHMGAA